MSSCDFSSTVPTSSPIGAFTTSAPTTTTCAANSPGTWGPNQQVVQKNFVFCFFYLSGIQFFTCFCFGCIFREPRILREAPLASGLVPEGGRPLPESTEGAGKGGLPVAEAAEQAEMGAVESSALPFEPLFIFLFILILLCCHLKRRGGQVLLFPQGWNHRSTSHQPCFKVLGASSPVRHHVGHGRQTGLNVKCLPNVTIVVLLVRKTGRHLILKQWRNPLCNVV